MTAKQKKRLYRIIAASALFIAAAVTVKIVKPNMWIERLIYVIPYLTVGYGVLKKAVMHIISGQVFDENFLMAIATLGAFAVGECPEAVFVMLFYQIGELFESIAVGKSRKSITALMDIHPEYATVERDGELVTVAPEEVGVGEIMVIRPGEKIPLDGTVTDGKTGIDTVALTGESAPRYAGEGDKVVSGCVNLSAVIKVRADKPYSQSTAAKILDLVENAAAGKAKTESFITRFARWYTPIVVISALAVAFIPPIFSGELTSWISRALNFLVISCPCALVISVPLSFFAGIGASSSKGILVKGSGYLESLATVTKAVFDKTGTLTEGTFTVTAIHPEIVSESELLEIAAFAECYSTHPISVSLRNAYDGNIDLARIGEVSEIAGRGVKAVIDGRRVYVGNGKLMAEVNADYHDCHMTGTVVHVGRESDGGAVEYIGHILISDSIKEGTAEALDELKKLGIKKCVMLTGDTEKTASDIAGKIAVDEYRSSLLPDDKVNEVKRLINENSSGTLMFTGDGINDAPVLAMADVGVAMGALGSDAAIEAADIVIMDDDLRRLPLAVGIARKTVRIVRENIVFSLAVKVAVLVLSLFGLCPMWAAVFADVGVMIIAVINAIRAQRI